MDSCQLIREETKMDVVHLNQKQLAARWSISEATLERWRSEGIGPKFLKLCGRVLYELVFLSGQLARRVHVVHFPRYREDNESDVRAYKACVQQFQNANSDLWGDSLMEYADALMKNTLGCVGTLKSVLKRAAKFANGRGKWSVDALQAALLTQTQREQILREIQEGEHRIEPGVTCELHSPKKPSQQNLRKTNGRQHEYVAPFGPACAGPARSGNWAN